MDPARKRELVDTFADEWGVELLVLDADEQSRLKTFFEIALPLKLEFQGTQSELIIHAAE